MGAETPASGSPAGSQPLVLTALQELLLKTQRPPTGRQNAPETSSAVRRPPAPTQPPADTPVRRPRGTPVETAPPPAPPAPPPLRGQSLRRRAPPEESALTAAPVERRSTGGPRSWLTVETGLYLLFFLTAIASRFWELGVKGLHHDESLHSVYSNHYYLGAGYVHSPMMHGPLQFHYIDFFYTLFGATNDTARYASAVCGIFVVMSPFFLRRQLGRWPALIATFLFLISPRSCTSAAWPAKTRSPPSPRRCWSSGCGASSPSGGRGTLYLACAGFALMFTIKETAYIIAAIFGVFLLGLFAWQMGRWLFATLIAYGATAGAAALLIYEGQHDAVPQYLQQGPHRRRHQELHRLAGQQRPDREHPMIQVEALSLSSLPASGAILSGTRAAGCARPHWLKRWPPAPLRRRRRAAVPAQGVETQVLTQPLPPVEGDEGLDFVDPNTEDAFGNGHATNGHGNGAEPEMAVVSATNGHGNGAAYEEVPVAAPPRPRDPGLLLRYEPGSLPAAVGTLLREPSTLWIGLAIMLGIYVAFYTSLFSNLPGLLTGLFGSVGYWIAQQEVARGGQPWYYYFLIVPLYEPLVVLFSLISTLFFAVKGIAAVVDRVRWGAEPDERPPVPGATAGWNVGRHINFASMSSFLPAFVIFWTVGVWGAYTYAGEKMPWLTIHIVQPSVLLAALFIGGTIAAIGAARRERLAEAGVDEADLPRTSGPRRNGRIVQQAEPDRWPWEAWARPGSWVPALAFVSLFVLICIVWAMNIDWQAGRTLPVGTAEGDRYKMWGFMMLLFPGLLLVLVAGFMLLGRAAPGRALAALAVLSLLCVYEVRSAVQLSYYNPDMPTEMAVYVQTSPDVVRHLLTRLTRLSVQLTGEKDMGVMYDSLASWPWEWYFRDFKNSRFKGDPGPATLRPPTRRRLAPTPMSRRRMGRTPWS